MKIIKIFIIIIYIFLSKCFAQQFVVEFSKIEGGLNSSDKFNKNFGRYDGYEIELYEGEEVNFVVYSNEFYPRLILTDQTGKILSDTYSDGSKNASIITKIPENGEWILYVVGDSTSFGKYTIQIAIAASNSTTLPENANFCTTLDFILAHANAYFLFFDDTNIIQSKIVKLNGSINAFIDKTDGSYISVFYEGNNFVKAQEIFEHIQKQIKECLSENWEIQSKEWHTFDDYKIKGYLIQEENSTGRYIQISLIDFKNSKQRYTSDYIVQIEINRKTKD